VNNANHNRSDGCKRFVVRADEKLIAFVELESAIRTLLPEFGVSVDLVRHGDWFGATNEFHKLPFIWG
jgi:hypothetical protein